MPISNFFQAGGIVAYPLLVFSIVAIALIAERLWFWSRLLKKQPPVAREAIKLYQDDPEAAIALFEQHLDLPLSRIALEGLQLNHPSPERFRLAIASAAQAELPILRRFNTIFDTIVTLSPLLGLLGTVLGLITAFSSLRLGDIGGSRTAGVTGGISEALVSTVMGLVVAIFTLVFANAFRGLYRRQLAVIQEYIGQLELLHLYHYERGEKTYATPR